MESAVWPWIEDVVVKEIGSLLTWKSEKAANGLSNDPLDGRYTADGATLRSEVSSTTLRRKCPVQLLKVLRKDRSVQMLVSDSAVQFKIQLHEDALACYESEINTELKDSFTGDILMLRRFRISITNIGPASERIQLLVLDLDYKSTHRKLLNTSDKLIDSPRVADLLEQHKKQFQTPHSSSAAPARSGSSTNGDATTVAVKIEPIDIIPSSQVLSDSVIQANLQQDQQEHTEPGVQSTAVESTADDGPFVPPGPVQPKTNKRKLGNLSSDDLSQQAGINLSQPYMGAAVQPARAKLASNGIRNDKLLSLIDKKPKLHQDPSADQSIKRETTPVTNAAVHSPPVSSQMPRPESFQTDRVDTSVLIGPASVQTADSTGSKHSAAEQHSASNDNSVEQPLSHRQRQSQSTPRPSQSDKAEQQLEVETSAQKSVNSGKNSASPGLAAPDRSPSKAAEHSEMPARPLSPPYDPRRFATEPQSFVIPADQAELLSKAASWIPPPVGLYFPHPNVPIGLLSLWNEKQSTLHREAQADKQRQRDRPSIIQDRGIYQTNKSSISLAQTTKLASSESSSEDDTSEEESAIPWPSSPINDEDRAAEQSGRRGKPVDSDDELPSKVSKANTNGSNTSEQTSMKKSAPSVASPRHSTGKAIATTDSFRSSTRQVEKARNPPSSIASSGLEEAVPRPLPTQRGGQKSSKGIFGNFREPRSSSSAPSDDELLFIRQSQESSDAAHMSKATSSRSASSKRGSPPPSLRQPLLSAPSIDNPYLLQEDEEMEEAQFTTRSVSLKPGDHDDSFSRSRSFAGIAKPPDVQTEQSAVQPDVLSPGMKKTPIANIAYGTVSNIALSETAAERGRPTSTTSNHANKTTTPAEVRVATTKRNLFGIFRPVPISASRVSTNSTVKKARRSLPWSSSAGRATQQPRHSLPAHGSSVQDPAVTITTWRSSAEQTVHQTRAESSTDPVEEGSLSGVHEPTMDNADQNDQALTKIQEFAINWSAIKPGGAFFIHAPVERPKWKANPLAWTR